VASAGIRRTPRYLYRIRQDSQTATQQRQDEQSPEVNSKSAIRNSVAIVTWNKKHFESRTMIEILTPKEYLMANMNGR